MPLLQSIITASALFSIAGITYSIYLVIWRLYFSPISRFPGPKLAALTYWYEFYYDLIQRGQFIFKIQELHKQYGPIIRINPHELHVSDPDFFHTLYAGGSGRRERDPYHTATLTLPGSLLTSPPHRKRYLLVHTRSPFGKSNLVMTTITFAITFRKFSTANMSVLYCWSARFFKQLQHYNITFLLYQILVNMVAVTILEYYCKPFWSWASTLTVCAAGTIISSLLLIIFMKLFYGDRAQVDWQMNVFYNRELQPQRSLFHEKLFYWIKLIAYAVIAILGVPLALFYLQKHVCSTNYHPNSTIEKVLSFTPTSNDETFPPIFSTFEITPLSTTTSITTTTTTFITTLVTTLVTTSVTTITKLKEL
ncbi:hypothetical protein VTL71DRAFT_6109 [Oculimacula yallundae]|uniref:Cytochrome P450 n=1 Tax=Oculimacula yallundae TaxID=86028 RepID=A0ABR4BZI7_9HELO